MSALDGCSRGQGLRVFALEQRRPQARQAIVDVLRPMYYGRDSFNIQPIAHSCLAGMAAISLNERLVRT